MCTFPRSVPFLELICCDLTMVIVYRYGSVGTCNDSQATQPVWNQYIMVGTTEKVISINMWVTSPSSVWNKTASWELIMQGKTGWNWIKPMFRKPLVGWFNCYGFTDELITKCHMWIMRTVFFVLLSWGSQIVFRAFDTLWPSEAIYSDIDLGRSKNTYELLNLRALKFSPLNNIYIFHAGG